jgi:ParB family chromosome partitioning protein
VARRSGLGKGLGALIPNEVVGDRSSTLLEIPVAAIRPNRHQPRASFDEESLASLTTSIRELGVLQPVLVRALDEDTYELIAGERRWRAAKRAGLPTIPAIRRDVDELASVEQALVENLHRQDLNPLEEAAAFQQLLEDFNLTHEQLSGRVGKSRAAITNTLRLFQLPPAVQKLVAEGQVSAGHARALLGTPDRSFQEALARRIVVEQLSVRAVEEAVRDRNELGGSVSVTKASERTGKLRPPGVLELEDLLAAHLDTRVSVELGGRKGRILIDFADLEDLERIYRAMIEAPLSPGP